MLVTTYFNDPQNYRLRSNLDLTKAIERYGQSLFRNKFQFDYSNDNPPDLAKNVSPSDVKRYFTSYSSNEIKEGWFSELAKQYIEYGSLLFLYLIKVTNEFSALQLPDKYNPIKSKQDPRLCDCGNVIFFFCLVFDQVWPYRI